MIRRSGIKRAAVKREPDRTCECVGHEGFRVVALARQRDDRRKLARNETKTAALADSVGV
jgi:hypothetical protein